MDTSQQLFFDDYFTLFPALEGDDQIHSSPLELSLDIPPLNNSSSSSDYSLSTDEFLSPSNIVRNHMQPTASSFHQQFDSLSAMGSNLSTFNQPLFFRKSEPVINHPSSSSTSVNFQAHTDASFLSFPEPLYHSVYNTKEVSVSAPPVKVFHIMDNAVIPKENTLPTPQLNSSFNDDSEEPEMKKKRRRQRTRHISKDLNAPSSCSSLDMSDHREILTGAMLKIPSSTSAVISQPTLPDPHHLIYESNPIPTPASIVPVIPLKSSSPSVTNHQADLPINFSREELLQISSDDFEEHIRQVSAIRPLTASERNVIKRQRRLIKNRESAQASRQRKKDYVGDLEKKVGDLISHNAKLKEEYSSLTSENKQLKNEVDFLSDLVGKVKVNEK